MRNSMFPALMILLGGMIDGVIKTGKQEEPAERASVLDQLKEKQEAVPPAPPRRCCEEKEL